MENIAHSSIPLDTVFEDVKKKNADIAKISNDVDEALAEHINGYAARQERVLGAATRELGDRSNALKVCTEKSLQDADKKLTDRLLGFYLTLEEGNNL